MNLERPENYWTGERDRRSEKERRENEERIGEKQRERGTNETGLT